MGVMRWSGQCLAVLLCGLAGFAHGETLRIGIEGEYPPFSRTDAKGRITGFDAEITTAVCRQLKANCKVVKQDWEKAIPDLNAGKIDALISSMAITEERLRKVSFTRPYYNTPVRFVIHRNATLQVDPPARLAGHSVVVEAESIYQAYAQAVLAPLGAKIVVVHGGVEAVWSMLASGKAESTLNDVVANADFLKSPRGAVFIETGPAITDTRHMGVGAAIAVAKGNKALVERLDAALLALHQSGEYARIRARYFDFDIWAR